MVPHGHIPDAAESGERRDSEQAVDEESRAEALLFCVELVKQSPKHAAVFTMEEVTVLVTSQ